MVYAIISGRPERNRQSLPLAGRASFGTMTFSNWQPVIIIILLPGSSSPRGLLESLIWTQQVSRSQFPQVILDTRTPETGNALCTRAASTVLSIAIFHCCYASLSPTDFDETCPGILATSGQRRCKGAFLCGSDLQQGSRVVGEMGGIGRSVEETTCQLGQSCSATNPIRRMGAQEHSFPQRTTTSSPVA